MTKADHMATDESPADGTLSIAVLIPTYNNRSTLDSVLRGAAESGLPVVVIDDASTDGSQIVLEELETEGIVHRRFRAPRNLGKAGALRAGFELCRQSGFTHAITCDSDAQHDTDLIPLFAEAARADAGSYLLGCRFPLHPDQPRRNLLGRILSNVAIRAHSGVTIGDAACGFRCWPLELPATVRGLSGRYAWEEEMITRAAWAGWPITSIDVPAIYHPPSTRVSHYRFGRDWSEGIGIYLLLLLEATLPRFPRSGGGRRPFRDGFLRRCDRLLSPGALRGRRPEAATERWFQLIALAAGGLTATIAPPSMVTLAAIGWIGWRWHAGFAAMAIAAFPTLLELEAFDGKAEWIVLVAVASLLAGLIRRSASLRSLAPEG
jgi:glycosyltransferase involved in cell wall biosynthesis